MPLLQILNTIHSPFPSNKNKKIYHSKPTTMTKCPIIIQKPTTMTKCSIIIQIVGVQLHPILNKVQITDKF